MATRRPKLILDTNVPSKLVSKYQSELEAIIRRLNQDFRVVVSPAVHIETVKGILNGSAAYFESNQQKLRILVGTATIEYLPFSGSFAFQTVLGMNVTASPLRPNEFREHARIFLHAKSLKELVDGDVRVPLKPKRLRAGFDKALHERQLDEGIRLHNELMQRVKKGSASFPPPAVWASSRARNLGLSLEQVQLAQFNYALDAAYEYEKALSLLVANGYNFEDAKSSGDWIDSQNLWYLCDPSIFLLTDDKKMRDRVNRSRQKNQIISLRDFLVQRGFQLRH
jgi:hypothetical protein